MARIPESEIERLKSEVSVERLIEGAGIALTKSGKDRLGRCPFHEDDKPSLTITPAKNLWHCFGCGAGGGPIDWVMKKSGVSFRHAVELLRDGVLPLAADGSVAPAVKRATVRKLAAPVAFDADEQALLNQVTGYYAETLKQSPEALDYLKTRGLDDPAMIDHFKLGYANRTLGLRLPEKNRQAGEQIRTRLQSIGIYRESGHEHFNGSLIVPVIDAAGNVTELYGRKIRDDLRTGTPKHLYLPGPHQGVWNVAALTVSREIILCEALIDALTFWCAGYRNVTASYGIEGFTDDMLAAFKHHGTERILIAYDRDEAGERAAEKLADRLMHEGIECFRIQFPKGMDANEYARKVTPAAKSLGLVIRKAEWLGKGTPPTRSLGSMPETLGGSASPANAPLAAKEVAAPAHTHTSAPASALPASPMPAPAQDTPVEIGDKDITLTFGEGAAARRYRVRGLAKNLSYELLKVNVLASAGEAFHVDTLDLYAAKQRQHYITQAAIELGLREDVIKADLGRVLLKLEALQDAAIQTALKPKAPAAVTMNETERTAALDLLRAPDLMERILADFAVCGIVGEATNKLMGYLAAVSRLLDHPLAVVIQSSSAAGKSSLMDAILALMPEEERIKYSAMTGQSLFYMGETNLQHKILAIVEEEGASKASYALKLLQSEGELTIASTGKDPATGNLVTQQYKVTGPVMIFLTTTAIEIDEELLNRCLVLSVDEDREQTRAIHRLQREKRTLAGLAARQERAHLLTLHQNAQRLLRPLAVVNPYADQLTFLDDRTRTRRDHEKYLTLIDSITLLHQHQRPIKSMHTGTGGAAGQVDYIEVTPADIARANALAHEVLGRSLDELPPQTRRLLTLIVELVESEAKAQGMQRGGVRFTRKALRTRTGWGDTQLKLHLARLTELEYLIAHREGQGALAYELLYDGDAAGGAHLSGLIDAAVLQTALKESTVHAYDASRSGVNGARPVPGRGVDGGRSAGGRVEASAEESLPPTVSTESPSVVRKPHVMSGTGKVLSYPSLPALPLAAAAA